MSGFEKNRNWGENGMDLTRTAYVSYKKQRSGSNTSSYAYDASANPASAYDTISSVQDSL
jgi:hypothetical protein